VRYDEPFPMTDASNPIVLYDGVCGLCNRLVQFILQRDRRDVFRFASLQSPLAAEILARHSMPHDLNSVNVVLHHQQPGERILERSDAINYVLTELGVPWSFGAKLGSLLTHRLRDSAYNLIARNRYRIWGKYETCPLPDPSRRHKFLD
jgi:predicted DCC family thiol-disulfide oxidoreductase YuxK